MTSEVVKAALRSLMTKCATADRYTLVRDSYDCEKVSVPYTRRAPAPAPASGLPDAPIAPAPMPEETAPAPTPAPAPKEFIAGVDLKGFELVKSMPYDGPIITFLDIKTPKMILDEIPLLESRVQNAVKNLFRFFSEFHFKPALRFIDSLFRKIDDDEITDYIGGYFELQNSPDSQNVKAKMECDEFKGVIRDIKDLAPSYILKYPVSINKRLTVYYGDPGTGKTYKAIHDNPDAVVIPCCSSITPDDLLRVFDFTKEENETVKEEMQNGTDNAALTALLRSARAGKPTFNPTAVTTAMREGKPIIFDEINMLPPDTLAFVQEITDGKKRVQHMGWNIDIKEGFQIIGTMNLYVNGMTLALPSPLVDRIGTMQEFELTPEKITGMIMNR